MGTKGVVGIRKRTLLVAAAAAVLALPAAGMAQESETGAYVGGALGTFKARDACSTGGVPAGVVVNSCSDDGSAWKAFAGYRFHRNLAAELSYAQTDSIRANVTSGGATADASAKLKAYGIAALALWPVAEQFSLFGKLGVARTEAAGSVNVGGTTVSVGENNTEAHYGLGATWSFAPNLALRAEWERFDKSKTDLYTVGVQYKF